MIIFYVILNLIPVKCLQEFADIKKGNIYGHCSLQDQFPPTVFLNDEKYYHFSWVGDSRVLNKLNHYSEPPTGNPANKEPYRIYWENIWQKFNPDDALIDTKNFIRIPKNAPKQQFKKWVLKKFTGKFTFLYKLSRISKGFK